MYSYEKMRREVFTDNGQRAFLRIRDRVNILLRESGAVTMECAIARESGDTWTMIACVDRMVELGELREIVDPCRSAGQFRIFVKVSQ